MSGPLYMQRFRAFPLRQLGRLVNARFLIKKRKNVARITNKKFELMLT